MSGPPESSDAAGSQRGSHVVWGVTLFVVAAASVEVIGTWTLARPGIRSVWVPALAVMGVIVVGVVSRRSLGGGASSVVLTAATAILGALLVVGTQSGWFVDRRVAAERDWLDRTAQWTTTYVPDAGSFQCIRFVAPPVRLLGFPPPDDVCVEGDGAVRVVSITWNHADGGQRGRSGLVRSPSPPREYECYRHVSAEWWEFATLDDGTDCPDEFSYEPIN